jgi:predicted nucleic acid-binding protein
MTLTDTSVWVDFFRGSSRAKDLSRLLELDEVLLHPWVLGELMLGVLGQRREAVVRDLRALPAAVRVQDHEVLELVTSRRLTGRGIGWVDAQLLASALLARCELWTFDRGLALVARDLGIVVRV